MQSMASACYPDDQARSSEGETSSEGTGGTCSTGLVLAAVELHPLAVAFPLDRRSSLDNHPTVPRAYLCEAVSTWRSGFRCVFFFFSRLGRQADCKLWWNRPGARGAGVVEQGSGGAFRDGAARSQRLVGTLLLTNRAARACPVKGMRSSLVYGAPPHFAGSYSSVGFKQVSAAGAQAAQARLRCRAVCARSRLLPSGQSRRSTFPRGIA